MKIVRILTLLLVTSLGLVCAETQYGVQPEEVTEEVKYRFAPALFDGIEFLKKEDVAEMIKQIKELEVNKVTLSKEDKAKLIYILKQVISYK